MRVNSCFTFYLVFFVGFVLFELGRNDLRFENIFVRLFVICKIVDIEKVFLEEGKVVE